MISIISRAARSHISSKINYPTIQLLASITVRSNHSEKLKKSYDNLLVQTYPVSEASDNQIALMQLNRPNTLNALSDAVLDDLLHASKVLDNDPKVRCLILTGSRKAFAAGADISEMKNKTFEECYSTEMFGHWQQLSQLRKPLLAAVSGFCLGGGCEVAMMCDVIVCSEY